MTAACEYRLSTPAGELCWFEWGRLSDAPSLLLVHATGFHARCWDAVVDALPAGTHVIAPDLRGHGRSFRPDSLRNWAAIADDLLPLVDALGAAPLVGAGHSMGGVCVTRAAAARPGRFAELILVDPVMFSPEQYTAWGQYAGENPAEQMVARRRNRWASADEMIARFASRPPYASWQPRVLADYCRWGLVPAADGAGYELACPPHLEGSAYAGNAGFNPLAAAASITCPVHVIRARSGERAPGVVDFSISPTWPELARIFPDGHDHHWDDCSHFIPMEAPDRLAETIAARLA